MIQGFKARDWNVDNQCNKHHKGVDCRHQRSAPVLTLKTKVTLLEKELPAFSIDAQKHLVTVRFEGPVTFDEIARYAKRLRPIGILSPLFQKSPI